MKKILLLGSGELGKEFVISAKRLGCYVIASDSYAGAPAMQVADHHVVFDMLDSEMLSSIIDEYKPDLIVPEIEAIRTEVLVEKEQQGYTVVPSARAVNLTMNRDRIRDRAVELGLRTARYEYANSLHELESAARRIGFPCVVKPVMSSSGKGQSVVREESEVLGAWQYAVSGQRGDRSTVIVEEFVDFDLEVTLLTVRQHSGELVFCPLIGHHQERGDYRYSWQPALNVDFTGHIVDTHTQEMAATIVNDLGGAGIYGVEFFVKLQGNMPEVIFSELSPRPHDTGMVTLHTQSLSEFDLHARAVLGLPIPSVELVKSGASCVILAEEDSSNFIIDGVREALKLPSVDVRIFGKPTARPYRRMGVVLADDLESAKAAAGMIRVMDITNDLGA